MFIQRNFIKVSNSDYIGNETCNVACSLDKGPECGLGADRVRYVTSETQGWSDSMLAELGVFVLTDRRAIQLFYFAT